MVSVCGRPGKCVIVLKVLVVVTVTWMTRWPPVQVAEQVLGGDVAEGVPSSCAHRQRVRRGCVIGTVPAAASAVVSMLAVSVYLFVLTAILGAGSRRIRQRNRDVEDAREIGDSDNEQHEQRKRHRQFYERTAAIRSVEGRQSHANRCHCWRHRPGAQPDHDLQDAYPSRCPHCATPVPEALTLVNRPASKSPDRRRQRIVRECEVWGRVLRHGD